MVTTSDAISEANRTIMRDVFEAADRTLVEVMRPRTEVNFLDGDDTIATAIQAAHGLPNSRYPVYGEDADDVEGFVHIKDLLLAEDRERTTVRAVSRPITMFPGTVPVLRAINVMRAEGHQIAIVVDEYGGTDGIVTMEDLLEEIVGDIYDEYDVAPEVAPATLAEGDVIEIDGGVILQEFEEHTGIDLPDDGSYQTVGGFVMAELGRVPVAGDVVEFPGYELHVMDMDRHRIGRIRVTKVNDDDAEPAEGAAGGAAGVGAAGIEAAGVEDGAEVPGDDPTPPRTAAP